jgi:hypothetical protein
MINASSPIYDAQIIVMVLVSYSKDNDPLWMTYYVVYGLLSLKALSRVKGPYFPSSTMANALISIPSMQDLIMVPILHLESKDHL